MSKSVTLSGKINAWLDDNQVRLSITNPHLSEPLRFSARLSTPQGQHLSAEIIRQRVADIAATGVPVVYEDDVIQLQTSVGAILVSRQGDEVVIDDSYNVYGDGDACEALKDVSNLADLLSQLFWFGLKRTNSDSIVAQLMDLRYNFRHVADTALLDLGLVHRVRVALFAGRIHLVASPMGKKEIANLDDALGSMPVNLILDLRGTPLQDERRQFGITGQPSSYARSTSSLRHGSSAEEIWTTAAGDLVYLGDLGDVIATPRFNGHNVIALDNVRRIDPTQQPTAQSIEAMLQCLRITEYGKARPVRYSYIPPEQGVDPRAQMLQVAAEVFAELMSIDATVRTRPDHVERSSQIGDLWVSLKASINSAGMLVLQVVDHDELEYFGTVLLAADVTVNRMRTLLSYGMEQVQNGLGLDD